MTGELYAYVGRIRSVSCRVKKEKSYWNLFSKVYSNSIAIFFSAVIILGPNLVLITPPLLLLSNAKGWRRWFQWDFLEEEEGRVPPSPDRAKSIQLSMSSLCFHTSRSPAHNRFWVRRGGNFKYDYRNFAYVPNLRIWNCLNAWRFKKISWKRKKILLCIQDIFLA